MEEEYFKIIVNKKLNGTTSTEEDIFLAQFEEKMLIKNKTIVFSDDAHRNSIHNEILFKVNNSGSKRKIKKRVKLLNVAASILILFSLGLTYIHLNSESDSIVFENNTKFPKKFTLIDGSIVTLNNKSKLIQHKKFNSENRFVELNGEAFFEIAKNKSIPFIIKTNSIFTRVVGTKFNINSNINYINVSVNEGHVKVYNNKDTLDATPNQQITYDMNNKKLTESYIQSDLFKLWTKDDYDLNNISIDELSRIFESVYSYQIVFKNKKIRKMKISITFHRKDNIDDVLNKINLINEFKLTKKQNRMIEAY
jgi:ferric-dicitrate binding protein FerR (iron transport regulator)